MKKVSGQLLPTDRAEASGGAVFHKAKAIELQKELAYRGHAYKYSQIKDLFK